MPRATKKTIQTIKSWAKLRHQDKKMAKIAVQYYETLDDKDGKAMLAEFTEYVEAVRSGTIEASPIQVNIPVFK